MSQPLITIITAVFNGANTLQQCIDSVSKQTYQNTEMIVIDGGSTDGSVGIMESNRDNISHWISEPDNGIYDAWNKALAKAKGEWICFLGADDYFWDDRVLEKMSIELQDIPPDIRLAYAQVMLLDARGESLFAVGEPWGNIKERFLKGFCLPHQGVMHRRRLFERNGVFDESFRIAGDYELMLRELKDSEAIFIPGIILAAMRQGGLSSDPLLAVESMQEIRRARRIHGLRFPGFFWIKAMARVYIRLALWKLVGDRLTRKILDVGRRIKGQPAYWTRT